MKVDVLPIGLYQENIYILHDKGHVLIVDPGRYAGEIIRCIGKDETVDGIILTHGHDDHTGAADDTADEYGCPVYLHPADRILVDPDAVKYGFDAPVYHEITDLNQGEIQVGIFPLTVYHTPGHTAGSVCVRYRGLLFSGDTLFAGSIGRTDLYSGDDAQMNSSLQFLLTLPNDLKVLPGHGPATTIGRERQMNPFLVSMAGSDRT